MKINTVSYFFRDCYRSIKKNSLMSIASVISIIATLIILGIFLVLTFNVRYITEEMADQLELKVFLKTDITTEQKAEIESAFQSDSRVASFVYQSKEEALKIMSEQLEQYENILQGLEDDNPLPESYIVKAKDAQEIKEVNDTLLTLEGVDYINYGESYVDALIKFNNMANLLSTAVLIILTGISLFLIYNTIKITVFARRKEIGIMKLVGATNWYIRIPFVLEGSILGLAGAILSVLVIRNIYYYLMGMISSGNAMFVMGMNFAPPETIMPQIALYFISYGLVVGAIGSMISIRKFLDV